MVGRKLGIVGSRNFPTPAAVQAFVDSLPPGTIVVSGGARGVDHWAAEAAAARGLRTKVFHADWKRLGRKAGPLRNRQIVQSIDELAAFWDGSSRGTLNTTGLALRASMPVRVFDAMGNELPLSRVVHEIEARGIFAAIEKAEAARR